MKIFFRTLLLALLCSPLFADVTANINTAQTFSAVQTFTVAPVFSAGPSLNAGETLTNVANAYTQTSTGLSLTSGITGFGRNITGTVNDSSAVNGIIDFANITCTTCTATSYLVQWEVGGTSVFEVSTAGNLLISNNLISSNTVEAASGFLITGGGNPVTWNGRGVLTSPAAGMLAINGGYTSLGTTFTVTGCGTAGTIRGGGSSGTFVVGTGAATCTFVFTINGATGAAAANGWVANVDDVTAKIHCTNSGTIASTTTATVICNSIVTTGDLITFSAMGF